MTASRGSSLLLLLLASSCAGSPLDDENARRTHWREQAAGAFACRSRADLEAYLDRIRKLPDRRPRNVRGGSFRLLTTRPAVYDDCYTLDEDFDLYVIWNGREPEAGIRSVEVVAFSDLRPRFRPEHFDALQALHRSPTADRPATFDPVLLIRAVNAVQALGERARPALKEYYDLAKQMPFEDLRKYGLNEFKILPVVQILGSAPSPFQLGAGGVEIPASDWPLFPLTVEGDVPFLVVLEYMLFGLPEDPVRRLGRDLVPPGKPLAPTLDPVEAADRLTSSPRWERILKGQSARGAVELKQRVRRQALEAVAPVYRPPDEYHANTCCEDPSEAAWRQVVDEVRGLGLRWDSARQDFIRSR